MLTIKHFFDISKAIKEIYINYYSLSLVNIFIKSYLFGIFKETRV